MEMAAEIQDHGFLGDTEPSIYIPPGVGAEQPRAAEEESELAGVCAVLCRHQPRPE